MREVNKRDERKRRRREENRTSILQAAEAVFSRKGYSMTTMDAIAQEVQFSKATLYKYFKSKREIFMEIIAHSFETTGKKIENLYNQQTGAEDKVKEYIRIVMRYYRDMENIIRIFFLEAQALNKIFGFNLKTFPVGSGKHPVLPPRFRSVIASILKVQQAIIQQGIDSGDFRKIDVADASFILGALIRGFQFKGPWQERDMTEEQSTEVIFNFYMNSIRKESPPKGV